MGIKRNDLNIPRNEEYKIIIIPSDILETVKPNLVMNSYGITIVKPRSLVSVS